MRGMWLFLLVMVGLMWLPKVVRAGDVQDETSDFSLGVEGTGNGLNIVEVDIPTGGGGSDWLSDGIIIIIPGEPVDIIDIDDVVFGPFDPVIINDDGEVVINVGTVPEPSTLLLLALPLALGALKRRQRPR